MAAVNPKTILLGKGKHADPSEGACVMELASMLANEPFTDRPACACPVIGGFLRAYNDRIDDKRRQDLYRYAAAVVGTRDSAEVEQARERRCMEWADTRKRAARSRLLRWITRSSPFVVDRRLGLDAAGTYAARSIRKYNNRTHAAALALIDELISMGRSSQATASDVQSVSSLTTAQVPVRA